MPLSPAALFLTPLANPGGIGGASKILSGSMGLLGLSQNGLTFADILFSGTIAQEFQTETNKNAADIGTSLPSLQSMTVDAQKTLNDPVVLIPVSDDVQVLSDDPEILQGDSFQSLIQDSSANETAELISPIANPVNGANLEENAQDLNDKLADILENFLQGLPLDKKQEIQLIQIKPESHKTALRIIKNSEDESAPCMIAVPLSIQKLSKIIENLRKQTTTAEDEALVAGLVRILPPEEKPDAIIIPQGLQVTPKQLQSPSPSEKKDVEETASDGSDMFQLDPLLSEDKTVEKGYGRFLQILERAQYTPNAQIQSQNNAQNQTQTEKAGPLLSTVHVQFPAMPGHLAGMFDFKDIFPEGIDWSYPHTQNANGIAPLTLTGSSIAASLVGQTSHAAQPHPATQIVASAISKMSSDGQTKNMTVRLEPPELGRLEIRMEFNKEKTVKVHLAIEKQETYLMLQRDAHLLERALADSGLSADGGGLSFELAQDNLFNQGRENGGGSSQFGSETLADDVDEIETTLSWNIDPATGMTSYDILA